MVRAPGCWGMGIAAPTRGDGIEPSLYKGISRKPTICGCGANECRAALRSVVFRLGDKMLPEGLP